MKRVVYNIVQLLFLLVLAISSNSCLPKDDIKKTVGLLELAINRLDNNSNDWKNTLVELEGKLKEDTQEIFKQEVSDILSRSISGAGTEVKCIVDFSGIRIKQQLENMKYSILGLPLKPFYPNVCSVVPAGGVTLVDGGNPTTEKFEMYGFDFIDLKSTKKIKVFLEDVDGNSIEISDHLNTPTNYLMTLNIGGNGVKFTNKSKQIVIKGQTLLSDTVEYTTLYNIGVFQPLIKPCVSKPDKPVPQSYTFIPNQTRGDREFNGHGPNVWFSVQLLQSEFDVKAQIFMKAEETEDDWTTAEETRTITLYTAPDGFKISKILGDAVSSHHYRDSNEEVDIFNLSGPVQQAQFTGDGGDDNDAGGNTGVNIIFSPLNIVLMQTGNCAPANTNLDVDKLIYVLKDLNKLKVVENIKSKQ